MQNKIRLVHKLILAIYAVFFLFYASYANAAQLPAELESDYHSLTHSLRCMVCQNQSIAESNASLAVDLREQVQEQLMDGRSRQEITDYMVQRYGDFIMYKPPLNAGTFLLWFGPGLFFLLAAFWLVNSIRHHNAKKQTNLSAEDSARARALLHKNDPGNTSRNNP